MSLKIPKKGSFFAKKLFTSISLEALMIIEAAG